MRRVDNNIECEIIFDSGMNSQNESIEDIEEELQVVYDSYRDTPKDVYEERFEAVASKLYEAQEVAVWERVEKNREASRNAHDEAHEDRDEEAVIPSHDVPQEVYANRWNQRDPYKVSFNKFGVPKMMHWMTPRKTWEMVKMGFLRTRRHSEYS